MSPVANDRSDSSAAGREATFEAVDCPAKVGFYGRAERISGLVIAAFEGNISRAGASQPVTGNRATSEALVWQPSNAQWWVLVTVAAFVVIAWPADNDRSLALKLTNWAVDPKDELPILPGPFALGQGDDVDAVESHDLQTRMYDELYNKGGWMRTRLELKVANDPFDPATERQVLTAIAVLTAFLVWRFGAPKN